MRTYNGVTAVVVGASGFIGRAVARKLVEQGAQLYSLGRADTVDLQLVYRRIRPVITFNLAGYGIDPRQSDESAAYHVNAELPRRIAEAAASSKCDAWRGRHFVHVGSGAEYGDGGGDLSEDVPANPTTLYGKSKWRGTQAVVEAAGELGLRAVTARLFTVYGPGERTGRLLPSLLESKRTGRPVDLSSGTQRRDFTYLDDAAEGLLRLGLAPGEEHTIVNLATGRLTSVRSFVETAADILGIPPGQLNFGALPPSPYETQYTAIVLDRLQKMTAWIPATNIVKGVRETVESSSL